MFCIINPESTIRLAVGRKLLTNSGEKAFMFGANAMITGNMLTISGTTIATDIELIMKLEKDV